MTHHTKSLLAPTTTIESEYLAFYFTRAFGEEHWAIHWYAPVRVILGPICKNLNRRQDNGSG